MYKSGSPCGVGKLCHNGRCITPEEFKNLTYDPANEILEDIKEVVVGKDYGLRTKRGE